MVDVTGAPVPTGASEFDVPGDLKALADHFGGSDYLSVPTVSALPAVGNWAGRIMQAVDTGSLHSWSSTGWNLIYEDTGWQPLSLSGSWNNYPGFAAARYRRMSGIVHLEGQIQGGGTGAIATLPARFRPGSTKAFITPASTGVGEIRLFSNGTVLLQSFYAGGTNLILGLNLSFPAEM